MIIEHQEKTQVFLQTLNQSMSTHQRANAVKVFNTKVKPVKDSSLGYKPAVTSICCIPNSVYIVVTSADSSVTVYDLSSQSVCGRLLKLSDLPTAVAAFSTSITVDKISDKNTPGSNNDTNKANKRKSVEIIELEINKTLNSTKDRSHINEIEATGDNEEDLSAPKVLFIVIGDRKGCLNILQINGDFGISTDTGARKMNQMLLADAVKEGCTVLRYIYEYKQIILEASVYMYM